MKKPPIRTLLHIPLPKRHNPINRRTRQIRHRIPLHLEQLMQLPIRAPIRHLHQLVDDEIPHVDGQDAQIGVPGVGVEGFRVGETRLAYVGPLVVRV